MSEAPAAEPAPAPAAAVALSQESAPATTNGEAAPATDAPKKLSPAELKKQKQAEKQAKRAQAKAVDHDHVEALLTAFRKRIRVLVRPPGGKRPGAVKDSLPAQKDQGKYGDDHRKPTHQF